MVCTLFLFDGGDDRSYWDELVFRLLCAMKSYDDINRLAAECLYTGMMTDTGAFSYNSNRTDINHNGLGCYVCESLNDSLGIDRLCMVQMPNRFFGCLHRRCKCQIGFSGACTGGANAKSVFRMLAPAVQMPNRFFGRLPNLGK